jgi:uncharacterized protein (TIGR02001 family)
MQRARCRAWTRGSRRLPRALWRAVWCTVWCALSAAALPAAAATVGGTVAASSDYVYRGFSQSRGEAVLQLDLHVDTPHWTLGAWASPVQLLPGRRSIELNVYSEWRWLLGSDFAAHAGIVRYSYPSDPRPVPYDYTELNASLNWRDRLTATLSWSPQVTLYSPRYNAAYDHSSWNGELTYTQPLRWRFLLHAGVGHFSAEGAPSAGYSYGSAGVQRTFGSLRADLSWFHSQEPEEGAYAAGLELKRPWVASLSWSF